MNVNSSYGGFLYQLFWNPKPSKLCKGTAGIFISQEQFPLPQSSGISISRAAADLD